ncbi:HpcH/HpaI aldolase/citrate lyase family protein [Sphingomonas glaciei]|uniref:CoA ester lyase n=1 Tax=Sphingomonas glaciei TaxID=2938948 RepID=A0ABY5N076_9SPHN|nr:CoA ester lyase [Sphingomonas glaciei]UUR08972.1 CoA ester lyase [Sphingomonas glaciei]
MLNLFGRPAVLFLPASRAGAIRRARGSVADVIFLDLEDAVAPELKDEARAAAVAAVTDPFGVPAAIRVNGAASEWFDADCAAVRDSRADLVIVPRVESVEVIREVAERTGKPVAAMIETPLGVRRCWEVAEVAAALIAGTNDLAATLRLPSGAGREPLQTALQTFVLAARAAGVPCFDGVFNKLDDADGFAAEAAEGRAFGFDGKTLIHPDQIATCKQAFAPTEAELARAARLVAAAGGGAQRFEGEMIERMHVEAAERLLAR